MRCTQSNTASTFSLNRALRPWIVAILYCGAADAQQESPSRAHLLAGRDRLLAVPAGPRAALSERGLEIDFVWTAEYFYNLTGGIDEGGGYRADISLFAELDTGGIGWWEDGTFFLHLQGQHGDGITEDYVGDFQVLSNIDADDFSQISELWYEHRFLDDRLRLKAGKQDANADFAYVLYGLEFINSSPGFSPTIPLVTYPDQDWGVVMGVEPVDWFSVNLGIYQGDPDGGRSISNTLDRLRGPMLMIEPAFHFELRDKPGHLRLGAWWNGTDIEGLDGAGEEDATAGFYLTFDQLLFKESPDNADDEQGIGVFAQFGYSDDEVIEAGQYYGAGMQWTGAIPGRDDDAWGVGVFHVVLSDEADFAERTETVIELFYKAQVFPWWSLKPDLQIVANPSGTENDTAVAIGLRSEIAF